MDKKEQEANEMRKLNSEIDKYQIKILTDRIERLEKSYSVLEIIVNKLAMINGVKIEKYQNGLVIIS